jgi:hypothetical protein
MLLTCISIVFFSLISTKPRGVSKLGNHKACTHLFIRSSVRNVVMLCMLSSLAELANETRLARKNRAHGRSTKQWRSDIDWSLIDDHSQMNNRDVPFERKKRSRLFSIKVDQ